MRRVFLPGVMLVLSVTVLAGCSAFRDRGFDYRQAKPAKPLEYPEGMRALPAQELYPVPELAPRLPTAAASAAAAAEAAVQAIPEGDRKARKEAQRKAKEAKKKAKAEQKAARKKKKKQNLEIPEPPQVAQLDAVGGTDPAQAPVLTASQVVLTRDGNGYPVLMLDTGFDWAWQRVGDALRKQPKIKVDDIDRGLAVYYVVLDGKRNSAGEPWQLKLNYTANGVQVALQVDEQAMAPVDLAEPLMKHLQEGLAP